MLCWRSVSESGWERILSSFANKISLYGIYECLRPIAKQSNHDAKPNIVDALLMLILAQVYPQYGTIHFGIVYQYWFCGSHSVLFMYVLLCYYIVL